MTTRKCLDGPHEGRQVLMDPKLTVVRFPYAHIVTLHEPHPLYLGPPHDRYDLDFSGDLVYTGLER